VNQTPDSHPFHLHESSFPGSITFRVRFKEFVGKTVHHCHVLPHEDTGMMQNFLIS
jgi:FtsP/CotA-like multicopper oxidase with cupredoxin domain